MRTATEALNVPTRKATIKMRRQVLRDIGDLPSVLVLRNSGFLVSREHGCEHFFARVNEFLGHVSRRIIKVDHATMPGREVLGLVVHEGQLLVDGYPSLV